MPKTWEQMTDAEKFDDLRRDVVHLLDVFNDLNRRLGFVAANLGLVETIAKKAAAGVEELKAQR
jgi:hypothetical protein